MPDMAYTPQSYVAAREALLGRIHAGLQADPRVVAAWLLGSYGRGEQDAVSDIDLAVVIDTPFAAAFCAWTAVTDVFSVATRMQLFHKFGEPANIHEHHNDASAGGTFTSVLYRKPPVIVDWTILPRALAMRPGSTRLLFDRAGIPHLDGTGLKSPQINERAIPHHSPNAAPFFWIMAAVTAKYIVRGRVGNSQRLLSTLENTLAEVALLAGQPLFSAAMPTFPGSVSPLEQLRRMCGAVEVLSQQVAAMDERGIEFPRPQIEAILKISIPGSSAA